VKSHGSSPVEHLLQLVLGVVQLVEVAVERADLKAHRTIRKS
jgi:hypothetical protein